MDLFAVRFGNEHDREFLALFGESRIDAGRCCTVEKGGLWLDDDRYECGDFSE